SQVWRRNWARITPFFNYPTDIRTAIYTTNSVESLNRSLRKIIKIRGGFPNEEAALKLLFLALRQAAKKWTMPIHHWREALNHFTILWPERMPENTGVQQLGIIRSKRQRALIGCKTNGVRIRDRIAGQDIAVHVELQNWAEDLTDIEVSSQAYRCCSASHWQLNGASHGSAEWNSNGIEIAKKSVRSPRRLSRVREGESNPQRY